MCFSTSLFRKFLSSLYNSLLYLTLITVPLISNKIFKFPFQTPKILSFKFFLILLSFLVFISIIYKAKFKFKITLLDLGIIIRFILILILSFYSIKSDHSILGLNVLLLLTIFYFLLRVIFNLNYTSKFIYNIAIIFLITAIIEIGLVLFNHHVNLLNFENLFNSNKVLFKGTFGNPNWVNGYLVSVFPFLFLLVLQNNKKFYKAFYGVGIIIIFLFIVISQSRGAWIALIMGGAFYLFPYFLSFVKRKKIKKIFILFLFGIVLSLLVFSVNRLYKMNETSANGRIFAWKVTSFMIAENPVIGIGYGNYFYKFLDYQERFFEEPSNEKYLSHAAVLRQCHNEYLQILSETGILGLSIFLMIIFYVFYYGINLIKVTPLQDSNIIRVSLTSSIIILTHSLVDTPLHNVTPIYLILIFNFAIISHFWSKNSDIKQICSNTLNIKTKLFLTGFTIVLAFFFMFNTAQKVRAHYFWQKGIDSVKLEKWEDAIGSYEIAEKILPNSGELKFNIGAAYLNIGKPQKAVNYINTSLNSFKDKNTFISLGFAYMHLEKFDKAEEVFKALSAKLPNLLLPHLLLAKLYYDSNKYSNCELEIEKVLTMKPKFDDSYAKTINDEAKKLKGLLKVNVTFPEVKK